MCGNSPEDNSQNRCSTRRNQQQDGVVDYRSKFVATYEWSFASHPCSLLRPDHAFRTSPVAHRQKFSLSPQLSRRDSRCPEKWIFEVLQRLQPAPVCFEYTRVWREEREALSGEFNGQHILVTGGSGFIGSHLARELSERGAAVTVISRSVPNSPEVAYLQLDLRDLEAVKEACTTNVGRFSAIVHCAAMDGNAQYKQDRAREILDSNVRIALNTFEMCLRMEAPTIVALSSAEVYGSGQTLPVVEASPFGSPADFQNNGYLTSKIILEYLAAHYRSLLGNKIVVLRPSNVYGPGDKLENGRLIPSVIESCLNEEPIDIWGDGQQQRSFLYVRDLTRAICYIIGDKDPPSEINISGKTDSVIFDVVSTIVRLTGSSSDVRLRRDLPSGHALPGFDISRLSAIVDFEFRDLESGLMETIEYYRGRTTKARYRSGRFG